MGIVTSSKQEVKTVDIDAAQAFFVRRFGNETEGYAAFLFRHGGEKTQFLAHIPLALKGFAGLPADADCYLSVASFATDHNRTKENVLRLNCLYCEEDATTLPNTLPEPSYRVETSAGRFQSYWALDAPVDAETAKRYIAAIAGAVGIGHEAIDAARVLRLPGTTNYKPGRERFMVRVVEGSGATYALAAFDHLIVPEKPTERTVGDAPAHEDDRPTSPPMDDDAVLRHCHNARNGARFAALFDDADISDYATDTNDGRSEADLALCAFISFYTQDPNQIYRIIEKSALWREKWTREDYAARTIGKAIDATRERFGVSGLTLAQTQATDESARFTLLDDAAIAALEDPFYRVEGIVPDGGLTVFYGKGGSYKSFAVLDMLRCIAAGMDFHGMPVQQGKVLYISAEAGGGIKKRVKAWNIAHGVEQIPGFFCITDAPKFQQQRDTDEILAAIKREGIDVLCADTLAKTMTGNENDKRDMQEYLDAIYRIQRETGVTVVLIHHSGWDESHMRGTTSLPFATDAVLKFSTSGKGSDTTVTAEVERMKDDEDGATLTFALKIVETGGVNRMGKAHTSVVLERTERKPGMVSDVAAKVRDILCTFGEDGATAAWWKDSAVQEGIAERTFYNAKAELARCGIITEPKPGEKKRGFRYKAFTVVVGGASTP